VQNLEVYFNLISVVVFGSVARGEAGKESDVDLLVVADNLSDRYERFKLFDKAEEKLESKKKELRKDGYQIFFSPIIKSKEEAEFLTPLYLDLVEDAVILKDEGDFFKKIMERLRRRLRELQAQRVKLGKKWYWILKKIMNSEKW
jgi:predicted nucleotidyltransferase